jgi:hypothetical protein
VKDFQNYLFIYLFIYLCMVALHLCMTPTKLGAEGCLDALFWMTLGYLGVECHH